MNKLPKVDMSEVEERIEAEQQKANEEVMKNAEEIMPEVKPRVTIDDSDIFGLGDTEEQEDIPVPKPIKAKRVMSEAQKANLKKGREKGLAIRRAKAQEKKEMVELQTKVKFKKKQELVDYLDTDTGKKAVEDTMRNPPKIQPIIKEAPAPVVANLDSPDFESMLKKGIKSALESHDSERKVRKQKKAKGIRKDNEKNKLTNMVMSAQRDPKYYGQSGFFDNMF